MTIVIKEFFSKLQYRSDRRSMKHRHQPWKWNGETKSDDENVEDIPAGDGSYEAGRRWRERVGRLQNKLGKKKRKISRNLFMVKVYHHLKS